MGSSAGLEAMGYCFYAMLIHLSLLRICSELSVTVKSMDRLTQATVRESGVWILSDNFD